MKTFILELPFLLYHLILINRTKLQIQVNLNSLCEPQVHFSETRNQYLYDRMVNVHVAVTYILIKMIEGKTKDHIRRKLVQIQQVWYFVVIHTGCYCSFQHLVHLKSFLQFRHKFTNLAVQRNNRTICTNIGAISRKRLQRTERPTLIDIFSFYSNCFAEGSFTRAVSVKFYHCANSDGPARQRTILLNFRLPDRMGPKPILSINVNLTVTKTKTVRVNGPLHYQDPIFT